MTFELKGDYFNGKFYYTTKPDRDECIIYKNSPADLSQELWTCHTNYEHVDAVIESAKKGYQVWRKTPLEKRIQYLKAFQEQVINRKDEFAKAIALETGKPLWEAATEAGAVIAKVNVTIEDSLKIIEGQTYENIMPNTSGSVTFKPVGPCFIIGPFNFPCHLANGQITAALLAGNSIIFKPSEKTVYSGQLLIECLHAANFPVGVVNLINGQAEIARRVLNDMSIRGIFFTGSKEVGLHILKDTYKQLDKIVALELGGKNTVILHKDAQVDHALNELLKAAFLTTGQRCVSTSKIAIHRSLVSEFIEKFHQLAKKIIIDHPIDYEDEPFMGPLIDERSLKNYLNYMGMAKREGFNEIMRGKSLNLKYDGYYVSPSIHLAEKSVEKSHFIKTEIFGPNCTFIPYDDLDEAIHISNSTEYGLAGAIFTQDKNVYDKCLQDIEVGIFNWNRSTAGASSKLPFGGVKSSGNFRPAGVAMVNSCVYPASSLIVDLESEDPTAPIKGIKD